MAASAGPVGGSRNKAWSDSLYSYAFISPAIAAMVVASFIPIAFTVFVAFTQWDNNHNALVEGFHLVGLRNFQAIWTDLTSGGDIYRVIVWTVAFAAISTTVNFFIGLFLAFLLNNPNMRERNLYRAILILPWAVPGAILTVAWSGLLNTTFGPINIILSQINILFIHPGNIPWLDDPNWARFATIMVNAWFGYPFMMTACLGALQSIPTELNEAAMVDGAGIVTRFRKVTFPLLRSATLPLVISTFAYNLNNFGAIYLLTGGGPTALGAQAGATDILPTYTYKLARVYFSYAVASSYAIVIFIFVGGLSLFNFKMSRAFETVER
jgi:arabinogalactan oligomer/maltooligosaccharide transport system permease protein